MKTVKKTERFLARRAAQWITELGRTSAAFTVRKVVPAHDRDCDFVVSTTTPAGPLRLYLEVKSRATPQDVSHFLSRTSERPANGIPVLCSYSISPRVADLCRQHEVGFLDSAGNCHIQGPGLLVHVEGKPVEKPATESAASPFAVKSSRILRVMLTNPAREWRIQDLAQEAQVSLGLTSRIKHSLVNSDYAQWRRGRLLLTNPIDLLTTWSATYDPPVEKHSLYVMQDVSELEVQIARWCETSGARYALTQYSGAWRVAPMVRYHTATAYIDAGPDLADFERLTHSLRAKTVESGANLSLWLPQDEFVLYGARRIGEVQVASTVQLYLDLANEPGRGKEAAEEVLKREFHAHDNSQ